MKLLTGRVYIFDKDGRNLRDFMNAPPDRLQIHLDAYASAFCRYLPLRLVAEDVLGRYIELDRRDPK